MMTPTSVWTRELEGGSLMDVGCYCISGSRLIAGEEPVQVYGEQVADANGVDRRFTGVLRFPSGLVATFHSGFDSFSESLEVTGREGTVFLPDPWHSLRGVLVVDGEEQTVEARNPYGCELEDMAAAIRGEKDPLLGREDAMGQARVDRSALPLGRSRGTRQPGVTPVGRVLWPRESSAPALPTMLARDEQRAT